jgi:hypothetical protein
MYSLDAKARNYGDNLGTNPRFIEKARRYYSMNAPLSGIAHVSPRIHRQSGFELLSPFSHSSAIYTACFMIRTGCALYCCVPAGPTAVVEVMLLSTHPVHHGSYQPRTRVAGLPLSCWTCSAGSASRSSLHAHPSVTNRPSW